MNSIELFLVMVATVLASSYLVRLLPFSIPLPLVQIGAGSVLAMATGHAVRLEPEVFFLLFLPPLLFLDGWRIPKDGLRRDRGRIFELAFGLVFFTVIVGGPLLHLLIPSMPLSVAFALAAVVSPTDPVAVSSIAGRSPIPSRLMHVLEGESLFNDASGLLCFRLAVGVALGDGFSVIKAAGLLSWSVVGGIAAGLLLTWLVTSAQRLLARGLRDSDGDALVLVTLVLPFTAYLLAERIHASGILAVVAAGMAMSRVELTGRASPYTRLQRTAFWNTVQLTLNGIMFVVLGEQLPRVTDGALDVVTKSGRGGAWWLVIYPLALFVGLFLIRFVWLLVSDRLPWNREGKLLPSAVRNRQRLITALCGVRGAVTLAGVLTLPLRLDNGARFPARDLAIFLAAAVILLSILATGILLPPLLTSLRKAGAPNDIDDESRARRLGADAAMQAIKRALEKKTEDASFATAAAELLERYAKRLDPAQVRDDVNQVEAAQKELQLLALRAERDALFLAAREGTVSDATTRRLVMELDLLEAHML